MGLFDRLFGRKKDREPEEVVAPAPVEVEELGEVIEEQVEPEVIVQDESPATDSPEVAVEEENQGDTAPTEATESAEDQASSQEDPEAQVVEPLVEVSEGSEEVVVEEQGAVEESLENLDLSSQESGLEEVDSVSPTSEADEQLEEAEASSEDGPRDVETVANEAPAVIWPEMPVQPEPAPVAEETAGLEPQEEAPVQEELLDSQESAVSQETEEQKYERSLSKTRKGFGARLNEFFANFRSVDEEFFEELEELLILSDVGVQVATTLTEDLRYEAKLQNAKRSSDLQRVIIEKLVEIYDQDGVYSEAINMQEGLTVMLFVGVNGVGKTTSIGKLAYKYKQEGKKVMLVAADTFRAGAVAQLVEWGRRVDVPVVTGPEKSDPASVVFDGMERALAEGVDLLMIDTAGRLQNKDNLMAELEKIGRIIKRVLPDAPHETLLAVDASTGQNALVQAKEFSKITPLTGLVLTKIDGTARGGVVIAIRQELDIPVKYIGFGEKIDDIGEFRSEDFMRGLLEGLV